MKTEFDIRDYELPEISRKSQNYKRTQPVVQFHIHK